MTVNILSAYYMPGIMVSTGIAFSNVIFTRAPAGGVVILCFSLGEVK